MYFSIIAQDVPSSLHLRSQARPDHLGRLHKLAEEGRLLLAGPNPSIESEEPGEAGYSGSIIIAQFDSMADAKEWANADPYLAVGVYEKVEVKPFKKVLP